MVWYIIAGIALAVALFILIYTYLRDRRYERMGGLEAMNPELREEIERERSEALERRERFREAMGDAMERGRERDGPSHDALP